MRILFLAILFFGWIPTAIFFGRLAVKRARENIIVISNKSLFVDLLVAILSSYSFYYIVASFKNDFNDDTLSFVIFISVFVLTISFFGFIPIFQEVYRSGVSFMMAYVIIGLLLYAIIFDRTQLVSIFNQGKDIYNWFMAILFPMQIGNIIYKGLILKHKKI